jgi:hypothetical protein
VLLRQVDRWIGLIKSLAKRLPDKRDPDKIEHSLESMLRQRIYALALGYEDLNDHDTLRKDLLWQTASERTEELASCSTPVFWVGLDCRATPARRTDCWNRQIAVAAFRRDAPGYRVGQGHEPT